MTQITVSDDIARQILGASTPILIVNQNGTALGQFLPITQVGKSSLSEDQVFAEIKQRMTSDDGARYTWAAVKERLRSLAPE